MIKIRLLTADGALVHDASIPPFRPTTQQPTGAPDVILWGARVFKISQPQGDRVVYREAVAYALG